MADDDTKPEDAGAPANEDDEKARAKALQMKKLKAKKRAMERLKSSMQVEDANQKPAAPTGTPATTPSAETPSDEQAAANENAQSIAKKRFEVKQWNAIGLWSYDINTNICSICKENIQKRMKKYHFLELILVFYCKTVLINTRYNKMYVPLFYLFSITNSLKCSRVITAIYLTRM